jgi:hypothetical protein
VKSIDFRKDSAGELGRLLTPRRASTRKYRLFAVACCRVHAKITDPDCLALINLSEKWADGEADAVEVRALRRKVYRWAERQSSGRSRWVTLYGAYWTAKPKGSPVFGFLNHKTYRPLLAEIVGPSPMPFTFDPAWRTDTAIALARTMYESREFSAMPILADALQDAGCENETILKHCRDRKQKHVRGCWVLDMVLGKQ